MNAITLTGFAFVPPFAQGLVRDLRVRWALEEAGLTYGSHLLDFAERKSEAYLRKQPFGMVPALEADGVELFESGAIVHLIAEDAPALMPADRAGRATTLAWMFAALNTVEPPVWSLFLIDTQHAEEDWGKLWRPGAVEAVMIRLAALEAWLDRRDYLTERFSAADILMTTVLRFLRHTDIVAGFPALTAYVQRCEARPALQKALRDQKADYDRHDAAAA